MARKSYVAGVLDRLETLSVLIGEVIPEELAYEFLRSTLMDIPRPPWQTGSLRRSGVAYIGNKKYLTTDMVATMEGRQDLLGPNVHSPWYKGTGLIGYGIDESVSDSAFYSTPARLKLSKVKYKGGASTGKIATLRGKVTVMYQAPHAALMHEWNGTFSDSKSGAHFISSKILNATQATALRIQELSARHLR